MEDLQRPSANAPRPTLSRSTGSSVSSQAISQPSIPSQKARKLRPIESREVTPSSTLLQGMIREKQESHRRNSTFGTHIEPERRTARDDGIFDDDDDDDNNNSFRHVDGRLVQSSPVGPAHGQRDDMTNRRTSGVFVPGADGAGGLGAREANQYISTLHKQNFDLKLELFHRRQRMTALEEQLEKAKVVEEQSAELQDVNDRLLAELEKRDQAVEEAVGIICALEEKVERLEERLVDTRPSTAMQDTDYFTTDSEDIVPQSSPPQLVAVRRDMPLGFDILKQSQNNASQSLTTSSYLIDLATPKTSKTPIRTPSFLRSEKSGSAGALRSLYLAEENDSRSIFNPGTLPRGGSTLGRDRATCQGSPDLGTDILGSPRLSVLSESSFLSVYGDRKKPDFDLQKAVELSHDNFSITVGQSKEQEERKMKVLSKVDKWMEDRDTPSKVGGGTLSQASSKETLSSVRDVLQDPSYLLDDSKILRRSPRKGKLDFNRHRKQHEAIVSPSLGGPIFGQDLMPPTPDTMSVTEKDTFEHPNPNIVDNRSLFNGRPAPVKSYSTLQPQQSYSASDLDARASFDSDVNDRGRAYSDEELQLTGMEHSRAGADNDQSDTSRIPMFRGISAKTLKVLDNSISSRSKVGLYAGDMMFNGEGIDDLEPSNQDLPSVPLSSGRRRSMQFPTTHYFSSSLKQQPQVPTNPQGWYNNSSDTVISRHRDYSSETNDPNPSSPPQSHTQVTSTSNSKLPRSSLQLRVPSTKANLTPIPAAKRPSLKSRLFGRSNSQTSTTTQSELVIPTAGMANGSSLRTPSFGAKTSPLDALHPGDAPGKTIEPKSTYPGTDISAAHPHAPSQQSVRPSMGVPGRYRGVLGAGPATASAGTDTGSRRWGFGSVGRSASVHVSGIRNVERSAEQDRLVL
ncbi:MAG: hypothetical protein M1827_003146 [Pycnora praestabilis]|nr:MAG: hypothetical protein M1827_003146 [Pycnora praestabilis]